jgi:hypothetical protein
LTYSVSGPSGRVSKEACALLIPGSETEDQVGRMLLPRMKRFLPAVNARDLQHVEEEHLAALLDLEAAGFVYLTACHCPSRFSELGKPGVGSFPDLE